MEILKSIDPFLLQLVIVPFVVIGLGVLVAAITKMVLIGPLVTLFLNLLFELGNNLMFYHKYHIWTNPFTSWNIIFPIISYLASQFVLLVRINRVRRK